MNFDTQLLHPPAQAYPAGATLPPISQVSAFAYESAEQLERVFRNQAPGFAYTRIANPTVDAFEKRMAALEHGISAAACSSGMAAVTMALLNILQAGDELIAGAGLFGGTIDLFHDLESFGIKTHFVEHVTADSIAPLVNAHTKAVFTELIGNPKLDVVDLEAVSEFVHQQGIPLLIDSTTATPYLIHPLDHGADIVIHSSSKYINGSGDAISGVIIDGGKFRFDAQRYPGFADYQKFGKFAYTAKLRAGFWRNAGACLAPMNAYLNLIGLETLGLRMQRICENAARLAAFLETQEGITVNYPALQSSPYSGLTASQLGGRGGGILTIRAGSQARAFQIINTLQYAKIATNIGDVRTLVIHPASTIYVHADETAQQAAGVYPDSIRISVGIEDIEDLIADFRQAIDNLKEA